jgi:uncharacterized glyoxalase superfamily protein PhnB
MGLVMSEFAPSPELRGIVVRAADYHVWRRARIPTATVSDVGQAWIYASCDDPDALCERARAAGGEITTEPADQDYGSRDFAARDLEGNQWNFGTYEPA